MGESQSGAVVSGANGSSSTVVMVAFNLSSGM